jgi:hypothetical protein
MDQELLSRRGLDESDVSSALLGSKVYVEKGASTDHRKHICECGERRDALQDQRSIIMIVVIEVFLLFLVVILLAWADGVVVQLCEVIVIGTVGARELPILLEIRGRIQVNLDGRNSLIAWLRHKGYCLRGPCTWLWLQGR